MIVDIGSGHNPDINSDILIEYVGMGNEHRWDQNIVSDRPTIMYKGLFFPIKDKAFDFSICKHVIEHVPNPCEFLNEIDRISKKGYIEAPSELAEMVFTPYDKHIWIIGKSGDCLTIKNKLKENTSKLGKLFYYLMANEKDFDDYFYFSRRKLFLTEYYWDKKIRYAILPSQEKPNIDLFDEDYLNSIIARNKVPYNIMDRVKNKSLKNKQVTMDDLESILVCSECKSSIVKGSNKYYVCSNCAKRFRVNGNVVHMY